MLAVFTSPTFGVHVFKKAALLILYAANIVRKEVAGYHARIPNAPLILDGCYIPLRDMLYFI
uniref:Cop2 n=1 Tax=Arundo donax TaxID=35708 RepID=A0A0A9E0B1_ARUDO